MAGRPSILPRETFQRADTLEFDQRAERDLWSLAFSANAEAQIEALGKPGTGLQSSGQPAAMPTSTPEPEPLPIVVSPRPETTIPNPQVQTPTPSGTPAAMPTAPGLTPATITSGPRPGQTLQPGESVGSVTLGDGASAGGDIDNSSRESFVRTAWPYALRAAGGNAQMAEMMLAKAISENGDIGKGGPIIGWNVSGIKGAGDAGSFEADTWESVNGQRVNIRDKFAAYSGPEAGFGAFMSFLQNNERYHPALARYQQTGNVEQLFDDVNAAGYATDVSWSKKLRNIRDSQVAPVVRGQTADARQSSMNAGAGSPQPTPAAAGPGGVPPAAGAGLHPTVAQKWRQQFGRDPSPEEAAELASLLGVA